MSPAFLRPHTRLLHFVGVSGLICRPGCGTQPGTPLPHLIPHLHAWSHGRCCWSGKTTRGNSPCHKCLGQNSTGAAVLQLCRAVSLSYSASGGTAGQLGGLQGAPHVGQCLAGCSPRAFILGVRSHCCRLGASRLGGPGHPHPPAMLGAAWGLSRRAAAAGRCPGLQAGCRQAAQPAVST